ncbi:MAG: LuxR C-terminal-related transcriptional regulator [Lachnospiraceae bacterium]|nr:LuxR C-terminal-related transcriptional regulator [Lachnospiraceae bacterium]
MDKGYIAPEAALKKLRVAKGLGQAVYIYGATGYGKTELVRQYLSRRRYHYISCAEDAAGLMETAETAQEAASHRSGKEKEAQPRTVMVVDDMHLLKNAEGRKAVLSLAGRQDVWFILICRSPIPAWLMPLYIKGGFLVITEDDLRLGEKEIAAYMDSQGLTATEEEVAFVAVRSQGNAYTVRHTALKMLEGMRPGPEMAEEIVEAFAAYLESHVMVQWDSDLLEFLMQISVTDEFTLPLAEMVTGNRHAPELLERAVETGNFLSCRDGTYRLRPQLIRALRRRAAKEYSPQERADHAYNAGLYYEMQGQIVPALAMFEQCGKKEWIRELLIRNARLNPGNGHYFELRRYYLQMEERELEESPVLMAGMSMLYSLMMQEKESEYWYRKLEKFASTAKGGQKREAVSRLAYLDIALPHRGSADMIDIMKRMPALIFDRGMSLPEFSVTSNYPSTMNGGKDFCHWSREDRKLAATIGKLVERVLGRYGKGLVKAALGESFYEKGEDAYEVLTLLARAKMEAEGGGMIEIAFAAVGLQVRLDTLQGEIQTAAEVLASFEKGVREQGAVQLLPNIGALKCRLALYQGDKEAVSAWMAQAPDEDREFCVMERYRYLTKVRCYLSIGEYLKAQALLEKLRYYTEKCRRTYVRMEVCLLSAIAKYRTGGAWKEEFLSALKEACGYRFIRLISEEGAAVQELFVAAGKSFLEKEIPDKEWLSRLMGETGKVAVRYPVYLKGQLAKAPDFCEAALSVLRLQAEGKSVGKIAQELYMKEATVKYHAKENYRKLGVSGKADAVLAARNLGIL